MSFQNLSSRGASYYSAGAASQGDALYVFRFGEDPASRVDPTSTERSGF